MTGSRRIFLVIRREWNQRVRSTAFRVSTMVAAAIIVAIIAVPEILGGDARLSRTVGLVGERSPTLDAVMQTAGRQIGLTITSREFDGESAAKEALLSGDVDVVLVDERTLVWKAGADDQLAAALTWAVRAVTQQRAIGELGLTTEEQRRLLGSGELASSSLEPVTEQERSARRDLAMIGLMLLFLAISFYGGFLLVGVIEEKATRVIEVLLSRMRPTELLSGKIAGIGLVGLAQLGLVGIAALAALALSDNAKLPTTTGGTIGWMVLWFILGYGFYAVLYGAAGSLVSRQEEAQSMTLPITAVLLVAYVFALEAAQSPDSGISMIGSFLPPTAPMVMIVRIANGTVPIWQILLSAILTAGTTLAMVTLAGRVYAGAALRIGQRLKVSEAWRGAEL